VTISSGVGAGFSSSFCALETGVRFTVLDGPLRGVDEALGLVLGFGFGVAAGLGFGRGVADGEGLLTGVIRSFV
jgi:hypothetical protein